MIVAQTALDSCSITNKVCGSYHRAAIFESLSHAKLVVFSSKYHCTLLSLFLDVMNPSGAPPAVERPPLSAPQATAAPREVELWSWWTCGRWRAAPPQVSWASFARPSSPSCRSRPSTPSPPPAAQPASPSSWSATPEHRLSASTIPNHRAHLLLLGPGAAFQVGQVVLRLGKPGGEAQDEGGDLLHLEELFLTIWQLEGISPLQRAGCTCPSPAGSPPGPSWSPSPCLPRCSVPPSLSLEPVGGM